MRASGNSCVTGILLAALLLGSTAPAAPEPATTATPATPAADLFRNIARPAPPPDPELEAVFHQPPPEDRIRTLFDLETIDVDNSFRAFLSVNAKLIGGIAAKKSSLPAALKAVQTLLGAPQTQATLATLRSRPEFQTPGALHNLAAAALANGRPLFALGALWLAEERWPGDPQVRFNLASLLAQHGAVNEAEALLDDLAARRALPEHPFGITAVQGADYLRAYIRTRQGQVKEAVGLLKPIVSANPAFGEAALLLALLEAKQGEDAHAAYMTGVWRRPAASPPDATPTKSASRSAAADQATEPTPTPVKPARRKGVGLEAPLFVDISKGQPGELPAIPQPEDILDRAHFIGWLAKIGPSLMAEHKALDQARNAPMERCRKKILPETVRRRLQTLERMIDPANARMTQIQDLRRALERAKADESDASNRVLDQFLKEQHAITLRYAGQEPRKSCPDQIALVNQTHTAMLPHVQAIDLATRRLYRAWHQYATALGSLTADPDFRAYLAADIKLRAHTEYYGLLVNIGSSCTHAGTGDWACLEKKAGQANERGKEEDSRLANCSEEDAKNSVGAEVSSELEMKGKPTDFSVGIEVTCDGFSLEAGAELFKTLGATAEVEFKTDGTCTIYLGPKANMLPTGLGQEATIKGGVYVTMDKESFTDVGVRSVEKATAKIGALGVNATASHTVGDQKISFIPGTEMPGRNAYGLSDFGAPRR